MFRNAIGISLLALVALATTGRASLSAAEEARPETPLDAEGRQLFREVVGPALATHCVTCHGGDDPVAGFDLSTRELADEAGMLGDSAKSSYLMELVTYAAEPHMPHQRPKLPEDVVAAIGRWIDLGAPYESELVAAADARGGPPAGRAEDFWSFRPLRRDDAESMAPRKKNPPEKMIDAFVAAKLAAAGVTPNGPASPQALLRRVYFDVVGLPPPQETAAEWAGSNEVDDAHYERLVDALLAQPQFGERWARHWLDVVRFAESDGFEHDSDRPWAYRYRDFVIDALNGDMPFDEFVRWQLAGDEVAPDELEAWIATGFLTAGVLPTQITEAEFERTRYDQLDDMTATTGVAFLGLTIGCARCHDHKFDPISSREYYRFASTFTATVRSDIPVAELDRLAGRSESSAEGSVQASVEGFTPAKTQADDRGYPHFYDTTYVLERGDPARKLEIAEQGFLHVLMRNDLTDEHWRQTPAKNARSSQRRSALASWIVDEDDGAGALAARVAVNRIWQHYFGRGIVATPNDFGMQGSPPSHPELLDWLASELIRAGWRTKRIHKLILMSDAYRRSTAHNPASLTADPDNRLVGRAPRKRLEAEAIRDALLACGGILDDAMYGPGVLDESMVRRSVYFTIKRSQMIRSMQLLDAPEALVSVGDRPSTTTAPQTLLFLNSELVRRSSEGLARRVVGRSPRQGVNPVEQAYLIALGRRPTRDEVECWRQSMTTQLADATAEPTDRRLIAFRRCCQALLSCNEFIYLD